MMPVKQVNGFPPTAVPTEEVCYIELSGKSHDGRKYMPLARVRPDLNIPSTNSKWAPWNFLDREFSQHCAGPRCYRTRGRRTLGFYVPTAALWRQSPRVTHFPVPSVNLFLCYQGFTTSSAGETHETPLIFSLRCSGGQLERQDSIWGKA